MNRDNYIQDPVVAYVLDGVKKDWDIPFPFKTENDIRVFVGTQELTEALDWVTQGNVLGATGTLLLEAVWSSGDVLTILRDTVRERTTNFEQTARFSAKDLDDEFNNQLRMIIDLATKAGTIEGGLKELTIRVDKLEDSIEDVIDMIDDLEEFQVVEDVVLEDGQNEVLFTRVYTGACRYNVMGQLVDGTQLNHQDYKIVDARRVKLVRSYPAGTVLRATQVVYKNDAPLVPSMETSVVYLESLQQGTVTDCSRFTRVIITNLSDAPFEKVAGETIGGFEDAGGQYWGLKIDTIANVKWFGAKGDGVTDDTQAFKDAGKNVYIPKGNYSVTSLALGAVSSDAAIIMLKGKGSNLTQSLLQGVVQGSLSIKGETPASTQVNTVSIARSGTFKTEYYSGDIRTAKYYEVAFGLTSPVKVGDILKVHTSNLEEYKGAHEVIAVSGNVATALMLSQGTLRTGAITATANVLTTVLQYSNISMAVVEGGTVRISNVGFLGACYPTTKGSRGNFYNPAGGSGVTGIISRRNAYVALTNCAISGVSGTQVTSNDTSTLDLIQFAASHGGRNGISAASTSKTSASSVITTGNLLDGIIAQDTSFLFAPSATSSQNGRHGVISANNSSVNISNAVVTENGYLEVEGNGVECNNATLVAIGVQALRNSGSGVYAFGGANVRATGVKVENNKYGVYAHTAAHITLNGVSKSNTVKDLYALNGGYIYAVGTTVGSVWPVANANTSDGSFISTANHTPDSPKNIQFSANGNNAAMNITTGNVTSMGMNPVAGINTRVNCGGGLLVNGVLYMKDSTTRTFWKGELSNGVLAWTDTKIS